jgi:hypothetical protein
VKYSIRIFYPYDIPFRFNRLALHQIFTPGFTSSSLPQPEQLRFARNQPDTTPATEEDQKMENTLKRYLLACGALVLAFSLAPIASAECGGLVKPHSAHMNWNPQPGQAHLMQAALAPSGPANKPEAETAADSIVGMWHVHFIAEGNAEPPDGTEVDAGYAQWHSDGTEIMNSAGRAPNTGAFCLGVWEKTGTNQYKLNHFAASWDPTQGAGGALVGPARIQETVTLGATGNTFSGNFTISQYDEKGDLLAQVKGKITATRIDVNTTESSIF